MLIRGSPDFRSPCLCCKAVTTSTSLSMLIVFRCTTFIGVCVELVAAVAFVLVVVPRPLRDWVYDIVARNRYRWFGQRDVCMVPTPELRARFLSD